MLPESNQTPSVDMLAVVTEPVVERSADNVMRPGRGAARTYSRNVLVVGFSLAVSALSGVLLPSYLTHHLTPAVYGGWILILQVSGYVAILEFGIQTAIAKYIAQHAAAGDHQALDEHASAGTAITILSGVTGLVLSVLLAALVPALFRQMSPAIARDVAEGVLLVGSSTAVLLACSSFAAFFRGMQRFSVPTFSAVLNKLGSVCLLVFMVSRHRSLLAMGLSVASLNLLTGLGQVFAWRRLLGHIHVRRNLVRWPIVKQMLRYCAILGIWNSGMLIIMGLDLTIVGHFDIGSTAFYAIAATPVTFLILLLQAALNPMMPAVSAMSVSNSVEAMGAMLARSTRYGTLLLQAAGLPLILFGYAILSIWVGPAYAHRSLLPMRVLILAQMIRNLCAPYATMVVATGMQRVATLSTLCEAGANLLFSLVLGKYFGAVGVATGTLIGAIVGVLVHFLASMKHTQNNFRIRPGRLFAVSVLRPGICALPTLLLLPLFWKAAPRAHTPGYAVVWAVSSCVLAWLFGLTAEERRLLPEHVRAMVAGTR